MDTCSWTYITELLMVLYHWADLRTCTAKSSMKYLSSKYFCFKVWCHHWPTAGSCHLGGLLSRTWCWHRCTGWKLLPGLHCLDRSILSVELPASVHAPAESFYSRHHWTFPTCYLGFWTLGWQHAIHSCLYFCTHGMESHSQYLESLIVARSPLVVCPACHHRQTPTCDILSSSLILFDLRLLWPGHNLYRCWSNSIDMNRTANPS